MHNHEPPGYDCPFCRVARGEPTKYTTEEQVVERTEHTVSFVSPRWWTDFGANVLVIPLEHHENIYDLPIRLAEPITTAVQRVARAMKIAFRCDGVSTRQHNEPGGNQEVWHLHVHVFPRWEGDGLYGRRGYDAERTVLLERASTLRSVLAG